MEERVKMEDFDAASWELEGEDSGMRRRDGKACERLYMCTLLLSMVSTGSGTNEDGQAGGSSIIAVTVASAMNCMARIRSGHGLH